MIRKVVTMVEETWVEGGKEVSPPTRIAVSAAVVSNPFSGKYEENIRPLREEYSLLLANTLVPRAIEALGIKSDENHEIACFGKASMVGTNGEIEHGSMIIHNMDFGGTFRDIIGGGDSMIPSAEKRGGPGASLDMPLKHNMDASLASYHQTIEFRIPDAPGPDEIVIAAAISVSTRPHPRLGITE